MQQEFIITENQTKEILLICSPSVDYRIVQHAGSSLIMHIFNINNDADNHIDIDIIGEHCNTELYGLAIANDKCSIRNHTHIKHTVGKGNSKQIFKYILSDNAVGSFKGELIINPDAQQTSAQQTNRNILLSANAKMHTEPQLEIYADDVKASHGASTGQLDDSAVFYMQQRGISAQMARTMLLNAFTQDIFANIKDEEKIASIENMIAAALS